MNDYPSCSSQSDTTIKELTSRDSNWWKNQDVKTTNVQPISPLTYAFMKAEQRSSFNFPTATNVHPNAHADHEKLFTLATASVKAAEEMQNAKKTDTEGERSSLNLKKSINVKDLEVVECGTDSDDESSSSLSSNDGYEPKAHVGWASFAEAIREKEEEKKVKEAVQPERRKLYVVRSQDPEKLKSYKIVTTSSTTFPRALRPAAHRVAAKNEQKTTKDKEGERTESDDELVDVVGVDEKKPTDKDIEEKKLIDLEGLPDLPPQRPQNSNYEKQRKKKELATRRFCDFEEEVILKKKQRSTSPPPFLEPQIDDRPLSRISKQSNEESDEEQIDLEDISVESEGLKNLFMHDPDQMLKTRIPASSIPILPLSKSIMERKKAAVEMTKNAIIKKIPSHRFGTKNNTFAPRNLQIPAYLESGPVTLYTNSNKPVTSQNVKYVRHNCRCADKTIPNVDMTSFRFIDDSSIISVRAHLCDQTRVMIARTALWNREYSQRLGSKAIGSIWQKPDEITAQQTGFCSATVRRCVEIAKLSVVPKCADRIGVSKNELSMLQAAFGEDTKFCGIPMRHPHILSQYYTINCNTPAKESDESGITNNTDPKESARVKTENSMNNEETASDKRSQLSTSPNKLIGRPLPTSYPPPLPSHRKTVLRWAQPQQKHVPSSSSFPYTSKFPDVKKEITPSKILDVRDEDNAPSTSNGSRRGRGRPKKKEEDDKLMLVQQKEMDSIKNPRVRVPRRIRMAPRKNKSESEIGEVVKEVVDGIVDKVIIDKK